MSNDDYMTDGEWPHRRKSIWWLKYAVLPTAVAGVITLANQCGYRALGLMTEKAAAEAHATIEARIVDSEERQDAKLDKAMTRIETAIKGVSDRVDKALERRVRR